MSTTEKVAGVYNGDDFKTYVLGGGKVGIGFTKVLINGKDIMPGIRIQNRPNGTIDEVGTVIKRENDATDLTEILFDSMDSVRLWKNQVDSFYKFAEKVFATGACISRIARPFEVPDIKPTTQIKTTNEEPESYNVIIAGGRDFKPRQEVADALAIHIQQTLQNKKNVKILCGLAKGADQFGKFVAERNNYKIDFYPADWAGPLGNTAGHARNADMANNADLLIAFWDGTSTGTSNMIQQAKHRALPIIVNYYNNEYYKGDPDPALDGTSYILDDVRYYNIKL